MLRVISDKETKTSSWLSHRHRHEQCWAGRGLLWVMKTDPKTRRKSLICVKDSDENKGMHITIVICTILHGDVRQMPRRRCISPLFLCATDWMPTVSNTWRSPMGSSHVFWICTIPCILEISELKKRWWRSQGMWKSKILKTFSRLQVHCYLHHITAISGALWKPVPDLEFASNNNNRCHILPLTTYSCKHFTCISFI